MTAHVLFESVDAPRCYIVGREDSDKVWLIDPRREDVGPPLHPGSIGNHMPYMRWKEFDGPDEAETDILDRAELDDIDSWTEPTGYELAGESGRYQQRRVTRGPRTGDVGWYDTQGKRFMPRDWKPGGVKVRVAEKAAAGAADRQALSERLGRHAAGHEANAVQRAWAKSAARMLVRHHGEGAAHRIGELADAAEGALSRVSGDGSHARWAREVLKGKLRQLHLALGEINAAQKQTAADDEFGRKQAAQKQLDMGQAPLPAGSRPEKDEAAVDAAIRWARKHEADFGKIKMAAGGSAAKGRTREQFLGRFGTQLDAAGKKAVGDYYDAVKAELKAEPMPQPQPKAEPKEKAKPLDMKSAHAALMKAGLKLDKKQREAVDFYAGSGYKGINKALRGGDASNRYIPPLDAAIAAAPPLPEGVTVYRGLEFMDDGERDDFVKTLTGEVTFPAYVSTSLDGQSAEHFSRRLRGAGVMLEIVPKHGLYVPAARIGDGDEDEFELLMRRGSRFRVAGRREAKGGAPVYRLEEIDNA